MIGSILPAELSGFLLVPLIFLFIAVVAIMAAVRDHNERNANRFAVAGCFGFLMFLVVGVLTDAGWFLASRFDWNRADAAAVEVSLYPSPDPDARSTRVVLVKDPATLARLFDELELIREYDWPGHQHAVGTVYALRLKRRSDGAWSRYVVRINPDFEPTGGGLRMTGVYGVNVRYGSSGFALGDYQAPELGRFVADLLRQTGPAATTTTATAARPERK